MPMRSSSALLLLAVVISCVRYQAEAGVSREVFHRSEAHPGKCVVEGKVLSPGQIAKHPLKCAEITCVNAIGLVSIESCDPVSALPSALNVLKSYDPKDPPTCQWGDFSHPNAAYPKCCQRNFSCVL